MSPNQVERFVAAWDAASRSKDLKLIEPWISDDVTLSSPALFAPKQGKPEVTALLEDVFASLSNYRITKTWTDGNELLFEFDANVGKMSLQGIDRISLDPDGKLIHLKVFMRPFKGLLAVMTSVADRQIARMSLPERILARAQIAIRRRI